MRYFPGAGGWRFVDEGGSDGSNVTLSTQNTTLVTIYGFKIKIALFLPATQTTAHFFLFFVRSRIFFFTFYLCKYCERLQRFSDADWYKFRCILKLNRKMRRGETTTIERSDKRRRWGGKRRSRKNTRKNEQTNQPANQATSQPANRTEQWRKYLEQNFTKRYLLRCG